MGAQRPGQVRFEAWVPEALMAEFRTKVPNRTSWLRGAMTDALGPACTHTERVKVGERESLGQTLPEWACATCGHRLT
jgi:hypothetical protein